MTLFAGYLFVPPLDAPYVSFVIGSHSGTYNSAWIGVMFGAASVVLLPFFGFFLVKNAIERDHLTGVGQIIATTPLSKPLYVLGKWLSNLAVFAVILFALTVMAVVMQFVRADSGVEKEHLIPYGKHVIVHRGESVIAGDPLTEGPLIPQDILRVNGPAALQDYLLREVQNVYRSQGVTIDDKHIEVIIGQMMRKIQVKDPQIAMIPL